MSSKHIDLAESIKKVHQQLRRDVNETPDAAQSIWNEHVSNVEKLNEYAQAMRQLAEQHWAEKAHGQTRLTWCYETIKDYFQGSELSGLERKRARDRRKQTVTDVCVDCQTRIQLGICKPRVLDVGSCYNAFSVYTDLETVAIDIAPADQSVHRLDFLRLPHPPLISTHSFDAIIFSLVLDYLPTCSQRLSAALIAHQLLRCFGLLLLVEADSFLRGNREKSWRQALETIGFALISNVKVANLYCMAFRKIISVPKLTDEEFDRLAQLFHIPQDIQTTIETESTPLAIDQDLFDELPFSFE